jgi:hypothetical protein
MPLSSWDGDALAALEAINRVNGTRHFVKPADTAADWYTYTTRNRQWRLDATVDGTIDAASEHVTRTDGWRLSADTVINEQKASVTPIRFTSGNIVVWAYDGLPLTIGTSYRRTSIEIWVEFDDFVNNPVLDLFYTGSTVTTTFEPFGHTAKITLDCASGSAVVKRLRVLGSVARRGPDESVVIDDTTSQAVGSRGVRAGSDISGDFVGVIANARGIASHVVWRYASPQYRPTVEVVNWIPYQFEIDLYDIVSVTVAELSMTERLFEVVGLTHESDFAPSAADHMHTTTYVLQECRVQADPGWFTLDTSQLDGDDVLAY